MIVPVEADQVPPRLEVLQGVILLDVCRPQLQQVQGDEAPEFLGGALTCPINFIVHAVGTRLRIVLPLAHTLVVTVVIVACPLFDELKAPERMEMLQHDDGEVKLAGRRQWDGAAAGFHSPQREGEGGPHLVDGRRGQEIDPTRLHGKELAPLWFYERLDGQLPLLRFQTTGKTIVQRGQLCEGERGGERGAGQLLGFLGHL